jgi:hypothetical protein
MLAERAKRNAPLGSLGLIIASWAFPTVLSRCTSAVARVIADVIRSLRPEVI